MNARQIEVFRAVMRQGSITAAAEALNVSQPAVSKVLRHFESQIGYRLFERVGGRLVATAEAHLLFRDADRIFREIEVLKNFSNRIRDKRLGLLRIAASAPPTFALLPAAISRFRRRNPGTRLVLRTLPAEEVSERLLIGDIDLSITMTAILQPNVRSETIGHAEFVVLMHRDSPLAALDVVRPEDLADQSLISYGSTPAVGRMLDQQFEKCGLKRDVHIEVMLSISAAPLVAQGLGVALVDGLVPWQDLWPLLVRPFRPRSLFDIYLGTNIILPQSRFIREFTRDLQATLATLETKT